MSQVHVITGPERRRRWSDDQKRAIVAAAFAPGAVVSEVARRADLCTSLIYRWRREFAAAPRGFAEVVVSAVGDDDGGHDRGELRHRLAVSTARLGFADAADGRSIEIEFSGSSRVRIPASVPPELAAAVIKALAWR